MRKSYRSLVVRRKLYGDGGKAYALTYYSELSDTGTPVSFENDGKGHVLRKMILGGFFFFLFHYTFEPSVIFHRNESLEICF
jgi:hypothetical protein